MGQTLDSYVNANDFGKIPTKSLYDKSSGTRKTGEEMKSLKNTQQVRENHLLNVDEFFVDLTQGDTEIRQVFLNFVVIVSKKIESLNSDLKQSETKIGILEANLKQERPIQTPDD